MKILFGIATILVLSGCTITTSTGLSRGYPSDEDPTVRCYMLAYEYLAPFPVNFLFYRPIENVPKRAVLIVSLNDSRTSKPVLRYNGKLQADPGNLDFTGSLRGNLFVVKVNDRSTHQSWTIEFQRHFDGQFRVRREVGEFRH